MTELCATPAERARKAYVAVLRRMQEPGMGVSLAASLGLSESTISRIKSEQLENVIGVVSGLGLRLVTQNAVVVDQTELRMLRGLYARVATNEELAACLLNGDGL